MAQHFFAGTVLLAAVAAIQDPVPQPATTVKVKLASPVDSVRGTRVMLSAPMLSADGSTVIFRAKSNLASDSKDQYFDEILSCDADGKSRVLARLPADAEGRLDGTPSISSDARVCGFESVVLPTGERKRVGREIRLARSEGGEASALALPEATPEPANELHSPLVSGDGKSIVFTSAASNLVPGDENRSTDVFLAGIDGQGLECISVTPEGKPGNGASSATYGRCSSTGNRVLFFSSASDLVQGDENQRQDLFLRDPATRKTLRIETGGDAPCERAHHSERDDLLALEVRVADRLPFWGKCTSVVQRPDGADRVDLRTWIQAAEPGTLVGECMDPRFAQGGRYVVLIASVGFPYGGQEPTFDSSLRTFVPVIADVTKKSARLIRMGKDGQLPEGMSRFPCVADDGNVVCLLSSATNLIPEAFEGMRLFRVELR